MGKDSLAQFGPADTAISPPTATARRLVDASLSANTRRAYAGALGQFDAWINSRQLDDAALAAYLAEAHDAVIAGLLFMGGLRRSEVSAQRSANVEDAGAGILVTVRRSKTNQEDETSDVRYLKNGPARAVRALRAAAAPAPADRVVPLSPKMIGLRFTAAAGGLERRVTAPSGRVGLASELTSRGASTTDVMLAGNWKTSGMVAHYSTGATAERGAVARYL